jgi:hypothetical protein
MDTRAAQAQALYFQILNDRSKGRNDRANNTFLQMAKLHEELARELLAQHKPDAYIELYAAITAWGEAGKRSRAQELIGLGRQEAKAFSDGKDNINQELDALQGWLDSQYTSCDERLAENEVTVELVQHGGNR